MYRLPAHDQPSDPVLPPIELQTVRATSLDPERVERQGHGSHGSFATEPADIADKIRSTVFLPRRLPSAQELVSAAPLAIEPFLELDLRHPSGRVQVDPFAPRAPDAAPAAHKRQILKERRLDRQDVKPGHALCAVDAFEHENLKMGRIVSVRGHGPQLRRKNSDVSNE